MRRQLCEATPQAISGFVAEAQAAPEELSAIANVMPAPLLLFIPAQQHGRLVVMAMLVYAGPTTGAERAVVEPCRDGQRRDCLAPPLHGG